MGSPPPPTSLPDVCDPLYETQSKVCVGDSALSQACFDARDAVRDCMINPSGSPGPAPASSSTPSPDLGKGAQSPPSDGTIPDPADRGASPGYLDQLESGMSSMFSYDTPTSADGSEHPRPPRPPPRPPRPPPRPPAPNPTPDPGPTPYSPPSSTPFWTTNTIITVSVLGGVVLLLGYWFLGRAQPLGPDGLAVPTSQRAGKFVMYSTIVLLVGFGIYFIYWGVTGDNTKSGNLASSPLSASSIVSVPEAKAPPAGGSMGGDYGVQWWMFIKDWDYKFGEKKPVIRRGAEGIFNPDVFLDPTENTLSVKISVFPGQDTASGSEPAPTNSDGSASSGSFTCSVANVPLQRWFAVSLSVSGRNVDIYLDGLLVRSCLLPGVPRSARGNMEIMPGGGFSGSVIDLYHYSRSLVPADAQAFAAAGTNGTSYNALPSKSLFGYTVKFGVLDDSGKEIKNYSF
jgi:hypothetical protein